MLPLDTINVLSTEFDHSGRQIVTMVSGTVPTSLDFPENGVYVVIQNRALQVASAACERRRCSFTGVCSCTTAHDLKSIIQYGTGACRFFDRGTVCGNGLVSGSFFQGVVEEVQSLGMSFLRAPRMLTRATCYMTGGFDYDTELVQDIVSIPFNPDSANEESEIHALNALRGLHDAWVDFLDKQGPRATRLNDTYGSDPGYQSLTVDAWYEGDIPQRRGAGIGFELVDSSNSQVLVQHSRKRRSSASLPVSTQSSKVRKITYDEDFDDINDLIEEEFPGLSAHIRDDHIHSDQSSEDEGYSSDGQDEAPAPIMVLPTGAILGQLSL
jgi:hypothetical protein